MFSRSFSLKKKTSEKKKEKILEKRLLSKKGQVEISETILVLLVIVILLVLSIVLYYIFFYRGLGNIGSEKRDVENLILIYSFASLPEIKCNNEDCIDVIKVFGFKELIKENKEYYFKKFGKKRLAIENIYPELKDNAKNAECSLERIQQNSFPENCGYILVYDNLNEPLYEKASLKYSISMPVSLYFANVDEYRIGLIRLQGAEK